MNPARAAYVDETLRRVLGTEDRGAIRLLDVGCGGGILTEALARLGYDASGLEITRVLRPGGVCVFDTINRTVASYFLMILLGERVFHVMEPNPHDWRMFLRPAELHAMPGKAGLRPREIVGLVPAGSPPRMLVNLIRHRRVGGFRLAPDLSASYLGYATKPGA